jgi:hypothetical protein
MPVVFRRAEDLIGSMLGTGQCLSQSMIQSKLSVPKCTGAGTENVTADLALQIYPLEKFLASHGNTSTTF